MKKETTPRDVGHLTLDALQDRKELPSKKRLKEGAVAIIECTEDIPCDPCAVVCRFDAISKESLSTPPEIDYDKCVGCKECMSVCPGLAIFVINMNFEDERALVSLPYEMHPVPEEGDHVTVLDRAGTEVGTGEVINIRKGERDTMIVSVAVGKDLAMQVRAIKVKG